MLKKGEIRWWWMMTLVMFLVAMMTTGSAYASTDPSTRDQAEERYRWDLSALYPSEDAWAADIERLLNDLLPGLEAFQGQLTTPDNVLACLRQNDEIWMIFSNIYAWANMAFHENMADNRAAERAAQTQSLSARVSAAVSFIRPELLELPESVLQSYQDMELLSDYHQQFAGLILLKPHTLSAAEEELLARLGEFAATPEDIFEKLSVSDMTYPVILDESGQELQLSPGALIRYLQNPDRDFRQRAYQGISEGFRNSRNTLAATLSALIKKNWYYAQARNYPSSLEASLGASFIPRDVYDNLIQAVNNQLSHLHRYIELRRKVMEIDKVYVWDTYLPLVKDLTVNFPYQEAREHLLAALAPLGEDYLHMVEHAFTNRWIDVYETEHKMTGAYAWGTYLSHPFMLLNYHDTASDLSTLAHEVGHALHFHYIFQAQPYPTASYTIFIAEIASTVNQCLLYHYLIERAETPEEKLFFVNALVELIRGAVYNQVMYAEFEQAIHERIESGQALSADSIEALWSDILQKYFGPHLVIDDATKAWWSRIPHFYYNFYVYQYATSLAAAHDISSRVLAGEPGAVEAYQAFLDAGSSDFPVNVVALAGVDMTEPTAVENLLNYFGQLVDELERLIFEEQQ